MISFTAWTFYEYVLDDNIGVVTAWRQRLDEDVQAAVDYQFLRIRQIENVALFKEGEFRVLPEVVDLPFKAGGTNYRLLASFLGVDEIVILVVCKEEANGQLLPEMIELAQHNLDEVRANVERRREYKFD
jgi:hypothetical protein